ncbi:hypothetical protein ABZ766_32205 [Streptomyces sp. NPDC006670]|uniref:hypothetical protein n=1 Tax=Streptomyces sp. NPDC006670 TaxID=3154476 RepID=UPI00340E7051
MKIKSLSLLTVAVFGVMALGAAPSQAAGGTYSCKGYAEMSKTGSPTAYSTCKADGNGRRVAQHRVVLKCDQVQGARESVVTYTRYGNWAGPNERSNVACAKTKNFLRGVSVETK